MTEPPLVEGTTRRERYREAEAVWKRLDPAERRAFKLAFLEQEVERRRVRPVPAWLARRRTRRTLALSAAVPLLCLTIGGFLHGPEADVALLLPLVGALSFLPCLLLLRKATGLLADAPDGALDERERIERGQVYLESYRVIGALLTLLVLVAIADDLMDGRLLTTSGWLDLVLGLSLTSILLPSAVTAWRWQDPPDED